MCCLSATILWRHGSRQDTSHFASNQNRWSSRMTSHSTWDLPGFDMGLPVAVLAWLGVSQKFQGQGLGDRLLARALQDCHTAGQTFAFVAVMIDCLHDRAKAFYLRWDFQVLPGYQYRLFLSTQTLNALMGR